MTITHVFDHPQNTEPYLEFPAQGEPINNQYNENALYSFRGSVCYIYRKPLYVVLQRIVQKL